LSVLSFHATKVFNTFEGGAIISPDEKTKTRIDQLKNFGHVGETNVVAPGINGKMSEINAAFGLLQLKYIDRAISKRKAIDAAYRKLLKNIRGIKCLNGAGEALANYAYFPILVQNDYPISRDELNQKLKDIGINPRRYFYPLITEFPMYRGLLSAGREKLNNASQASLQVLCLPIYPDLEIEVVEKISSFIATQ
jgi:dTDP-4-amino-4,6-dideoxygalactose transaminase